MVFDIRAVFLSLVPTAFFSFFSKLSMSITIELFEGLNNAFESLPTRGDYLSIEEAGYRFWSTKLFDPADKKSSPSLAV